MPSITTIVIFNMPAASSTAFLIAWRENNAFICRQPGQMGGACYRSRASGERARFVNVALWESEAAMQTAREASANFWART